MAWSLTAKGELTKEGLLSDSGEVDCMEVLGPRMESDRRAWERSYLSRWGLLTLEQRAQAETELFYIEEIERLRAKVVELGGDPNDRGSGKETQESNSMDVRDVPSGDRG